MSSGLKNKTAKIRRIFERCFMGGENNAVRISENGDVKKRKSSYIKKIGRLLTVLCIVVTFLFLWGGYLGQVVSSSCATFVFPVFGRKSCFLGVNIRYSSFYFIRHILQVFICLPLVGVETFPFEMKFQKLCHCFYCWMAHL